MCIHAAESLILVRRNNAQIPPRIRTCELSFLKVELVSPEDKKPMATQPPRAINPIPRVKLDRSR